VTLSHIIITRFSYRGKDVFKQVSGPTFPRDDDPLDPARLEPRFELFELACLPSVLAQTDQDFTWVVLVDSKLPQQYSERLRALLSRRERSYVHVFEPGSDLGRLGWLRPYLAEGDQQVITTNFDDDDALPLRFAEVLHELARGRGQRLPPIGILGARRIVQWDLMRSPEAPIGWKAPWHRRTRVASVGLSLRCAYPAFDFCVLGLRHAHAEAYLDFWSPPLHPNAAWVQGEVLKAAQTARIDLRIWQPDAFFRDLSRDLGPVLMTNHGYNAQAERLFEDKPGRTPVTGAADFPDFSLNWDKASACVREYRSR
jgi:hypothetical protein